MKEKVTMQNSTLDFLLWFGVVVLLFVGVGGHYSLSDLSPLIKVVSWLIIAALVFGLVMNTKLGKAIWGYWQESLFEVRKVVWPTKKETIQMTLIVLAMVFVMGLVLWMMDAVLIKLVGLLLGHSGV